jgi:hypothetical protein
MVNSISGGSGISPVDSVPDELIALEEFVVDNPDLERLEALIARFNVFEALGVVRQELRHSDFLAFLLDARQSHGLGDALVKRLLQAVVRTASVIPAGLTPIHIDLMSFDRLVVRREWQAIDILLTDETNRLAVIVENKIDSTEHSNQLARYWDIVTHDHPDWRVLGVYLTPDGDPPSDERYVSISYGDICGLVETLTMSRASNLDAAVRTMLDHYAQMLRRHIVSESEVAALCRQIYLKHRAALDLVFEHRPDHQAELKAALETLIGEVESIIYDGGSKEYFYFLPTAWDVPALNQGVGWLKTGRLVAFSVHNRAQELTLRLYLGPGPEDIRRAMFSSFVSGKPPFKLRSKTLSKKWNLLYQRQLLGRDTYTDATLEEQIEQLRQNWHRFVRDDLPSLTSGVVGAMESAQRQMSEADR